MERKDGRRQVIIHSLRNTNSNDWMLPELHFRTLTLPRHRYTTCPYRINQLNRCHVSTRKASSLDLDRRRDRSENAPVVEVDSGEVIELGDTEEG